MKPEEVESTIKRFQAVLRLMRQPEHNLSLAQLVFKKYLEFERVDKTAKYIRSSGRQMPNGNSIQTNHISEILDSNPKDVEPDVIFIAQSIFNKNRRLASFLWG